MDCAEMTYEDSDVIIVVSLFCLVAVDLVLEFKLDGE